MCEMRIHGYARVSSKDQNAERQIAALKEFGVQDRDIYTDKISGKSFDRPAYNTMINMLRKGDLLVIQSIDRLGRNYTEIQGQWKHITEEVGADIKVLDMPLLDTRTTGDTIDSRFVADLTLQILSYVAQKERESIKVRQAQGIAAAKAKGRVLGRPKATYPDNWKEVYKEWKEGAITAVKAMDKLGLKRCTFYKLVKRYEAQ